MSGEATGGILVDHQIEALLGGAIRPVEGGDPVSPQQVQPASLDLRLGAVAHRIRAGFLPESVPVHDRLAELEATQLSLDGEGAVLERGGVYLIELQEELDLAPDVVGRFNPRSSAGRCDIFSRVLASGHARFDETPAGYRGRLWVELAPLSFPVRLRRGDRISQLRLQRGAQPLTRDEVLEAHGRAPLCYDRSGPLPAERLRIDDEGAMALRLGLEGRSPCGWRAARNTEVLQFAGTGVHDRDDFWEPVRARRGHCVLEPGCFYILASKERFAIPSNLAAEMLPIDVAIGELRNNYAGFFDPGFGRASRGHGGGTPAVLEVRAHDVPFLIEDGQVFFRLRFFRTLGEPAKLYAEGRTGPSYGSQDLTLARPFRS